MDQTNIKALKNRTSKVPAEQSRGNIEKILVEMGASDVARSYVDKRVAAFKFRIDNELYQLPCEEEKIAKALMEGKKNITPVQRENFIAQAERTAWKLILEWVQIMRTMHELGQMDMRESLFSRRLNKQGTQTLFQAFEEQQLMIE